MGGSEKSQFWCCDEDADLEMDRVTADARSDQIGSHMGSQALGEVCHRLVDEFLW